MAKDAESRKDIAQRVENNPEGEEKRPMEEKQRMSQERAGLSARGRDDASNQGGRSRMASPDSSSANADADGPSRQTSEASWCSGQV